MMETHQHHQQLLRGDSDKYVIILIISGALHLVFNILPLSTEVFSYFPFSDIQLSPQMYVWFISKNIGECLLYYIIWRLSGNEVLKYFFILQAVIFADFLLSYNSPIFIIGGIKYGVIHLTIMFKIGLLLIIWKRQ